MMNRSNHNPYLCLVPDLNLESFKVSPLNIRFGLNYQISYWESCLILYLLRASLWIDTEFHHVIFFYIYWDMVFLLQSDNAMNSTDFLLTLPHISKMTPTQYCYISLFVNPVYIFSYITLSYFLNQGHATFINEGGIISSFNFLYDSKQVYFWEEFLLLTDLMIIRVWKLLNYNFSYVGFINNITKNLWTPSSFFIYWNRLFKIPYCIFNMS